MIRDEFLVARRILKKEKNILLEIESLLKNTDKIKNRALVLSHKKELINALLKEENNLIRQLQRIKLIQPLPKKETNYLNIEKKQKEKEKKEIKKLPIFSAQNIKIKRKKKKEKIVLSNIEKITLQRLGKKEKKVEIYKEKKPSFYFILANKLFFNLSHKLAKKPIFKNLQRDLNKTNLQFILPSYIAVMLTNTLISFILSLFIFIFFLFFNITATLPIVVPVQTPLLQRAFQIMWVVVIIPLAVFIISYLYPVLERKAEENGINQELPFATIHMAAISGSMIEPSKIFRILLSTKEYNFLSKELTKLVNEINIYGKDLVTALKKIAYDSPSSKFSDLLNGLATTITTGGSLPEFFQKRAESLLFEYKIEKEKMAKAAETFMDIYISVVIAAPMILMLLLVMMKISGLGIALSTSTLGLVMVLGVVVLNIIFLTFLFLKNPKE